jgi:hypothetical protein
MILREFLYVDTEKTRALLGQLDGGIREEIKESETRSDAAKGGVRGFVERGANWATESQVSKTLGDVLFPELETALESEGFLADLSEELQESRNWSDLQEHYPPGSIIRLTAPASLFDARYLAASFAGMSATIQGLAGIGVDVSATASGGSPANRSQGATKGGAKGPAKRFGVTPDSLESQIADIPAGTGVTADMMRGMVRVARGLFAPGVHMIFSPTDDEEYVVTTRLQEGRAYLDTEPEILFARFGLVPQEWTIVGSVGHYASPGGAENSSNSPMNAAGQIVRGRMTAIINGFLDMMGTVGFGDLPQHPSFPIVPIAVYRTILPRDVNRDALP